MLNTAACMQVLEDSLDRLSLHSISGSRSNSRESLQSSSKYDSAFGSHYSEDNLSLSSSVVTGSYPAYPVETSMLPTILTPPLPYCVTTPTAGRWEGQSQRQYQHTSPHTTKKVKDKGLREHVLKKNVISSPSKVSSTVHHSPSPTRTQELTPSDVTYRAPSPALSPTQELAPDDDVPPLEQTILPTPHKPEVVYVEPTPPEKHKATPTKNKATPTRHKTAPPRYKATPTRLKATPTNVKRTSSIKHKATPVISKATPLTTPTHRRLSIDSTSTEGLISNDSTPTLSRHRPHPAPQQESLNPIVIIQNPPTSDSDDDVDYPRQYSPRLRQAPQFPKQGTLFYQDNLTPQPSPLHTARQHNRHSTSPSHLLPSRYLDTSHSRPNARPKRSASILQRLKRKRGSFKEDSRLKKKLPVKRSLSERVAYEIKKGWVDYEEDLDFISQPSHPRAVGRMIDKQEGRLHVVQLYKPPNGRYGVYISQQGNKNGIFISRFADDHAAKFYTGLISPGDQIVRVNGRNIVHESVDQVYDLMTNSDSVIFTVIPVSSHSSWW